ncbi:hypothetical protein G6F46_000887 [Rhizopus delemar]|uniref:Uncharacterized protein n=2 Tax=Rhizopus TaxID=4842 RepID=A0A9P6Z983_9FUNG|nr:hypothetical protein G6F36_011145 [Rhizopus arrhizus]KAG1460027.1 hypothetical protein G6F55_004414 [Rhizopus delemar]KAG1498352.1 hypothetical protein G6F54_005142 [Rhizopus delemar]KAG1515674.1 hypothetical protein G6F53_002734 [Rhizopus delemar]KAG1527073.1 hypothetical protein G6F52_001868 [Rhizopus delemar]
MEANSKSVEENTGLSQRSDSDHTIVANPILVESPTEDETTLNTDGEFGQISFLNAHNHLPTPTLNVYRPSIASVFNIIHEKRRPIVEDPLIASFFQAKRKSEVRGQNEGLDVAQLQKKTVIWMGIATMMRPRLDLERLQYQDVEFKWSDDGQLLGISLTSRQ